MPIWACDLHIKIKQIQRLTVDEKLITKVAVESLADKGMHYSSNSAKYLAKIILSKGTDIQVMDNFFAKASISLYKSGQMQNYTHGQGKTYDLVGAAYSEEMFVMAIQKAVGHLPDCVNSN